MIIPNVRKEEKGSTIISVGTNLTIHACPEYAEKACIALGAFLPQCTVTQAENALIRVVHNDALAEEAYHLEIRENGITIACADYLGLRNALATLSVMATCRDGKLNLPETCIDDAPVAKHRGAMLDLASRVLPYETLCNDLILMAKARMNIAHLYLFDRNGVYVQLESLPENCWMKNACTKEEMRKVCEFADALGLTVIPEFDMPGHSRLFFKVFEDFRCDAPIPEGMKVTSVCTGQPKLYEFYEKLIGEILDVFPGPYFHMGGDEVEMLDLKVVCLWDNCPRCQKLRKEQNLKDRQEQYYYFVKRINEIVKKAGRTLIMWSDQLDCPRGAMLPIDIIMHFWRVAFPSRGPYVGCSMNAQLSLGYTLINSDYPQTYTFTGEPIIMTSESVRTWLWDREPETEEKYRPQIRGSELCVWGYTAQELCAYMEHFLPSTIVLMGDKLWNNEVLEYTEEYCQKLTRVVLGASVPEGFNVFAAIGDVMPPTDNKKKSYYERVTCSDAEIQKIIDTLSQPDTYFGGDAARAKAYLACAQYTLEKRNEK